MKGHPMTTAIIVAALTGAWFGLVWVLRRDHTTQVRNVERALDAYRAYEADLNAILDRRHRGMNIVFSCPYCSGDLEDEPFNFYCRTCQASVSMPAAVLEASDD